MDPEVLISGPAGTGKSRACLEKLLGCAVRYPGMRGLILRKTRESLSEAALMTWEKYVVPSDWSILAGPQRNMRQHYHLRNGSEIVVGGLDKATKIMSTDYDMIYVQEATEITEDDLELCTTRLRTGKVPYQQVLMDCNPDAPHHWLYQRCSRGQTTLFNSRHEENPTVTEDYLAKLKALTGVRHKRLYLGLWVAAEGMVYDGWDPAIHRVDRFPIPKDWARYWAVDFGYTNPLSISAWAADADGRLYCYLQTYQTQTLVEDAASLWLAATADDPRPRAIICDHDAEDRATLGKHLKMQTTAAYKAVSPGIQAVATRLRPAGDGKPRLFYLRDSLIRRDPELVEKKLPVCIEEEYDSYIWDLANNRKKGEEPLKQNDHGMDATRYLVAYVDGIGPRWIPTSMLGPAREMK
jgi:PBSX family phage terminase large subunit